MLNFISRNTPKVKDNFLLREINSPDGCDCYEIYAEDKKIVLAGNSNLSLAMAYYRYLNEYCSVVITSGDFDVSAIAATPLPTEKITCRVAQKIRARTSYEMFALEGNFWGFDRWEKEIDFMAMHGFNAALQPVGFDGVLYRTMTELGMAENFSAEFSSGPAFLMRQLTGNAAGINSVNSVEYLERKIAVGRMITEREKQLGITPIFPAAMPSVPFSLRKKYIKMDILKAPLWYNMPPNFYIKPDNAFFNVFNLKFLKIQSELLGETHSYFFEPIYDADKKGYNSYLAALGKALSETLEEFDEKAVCFTHASSLNSEFFKQCSPEKYIVIDDNAAVSGGEIPAVNFLVSIAGNRFGRTGIYGDMDAVCRCPYSESRPALGTAAELDTFGENPLYCAAVLKALTADAPFDPDAFTKDFAQKRYRTDAYTDELIQLKNLCLNTQDCAGSIICARPATVIKHTAPFDSVERKFDFHQLYEIAKKFVEKDERKNEFLRQDIQSVVRQFLSELAYPVYLKATEFFKAKNVSAFEQASNLFLEICEDADRLLKTREQTNLFTKIEEARSLGSSKEEKQSLEINFLMLHTIWGPVDHTVLYDTAWCEWGGMVKDFYAQRWFMYFRSLAAYFDNPKKLKDVSRKQPYDRNEYKGSYQAKRLALFENNFLENYIPRRDGICVEDTVEAAREIIEKYSEVVKQF